ncbi:sulfotransferase [Nostocoides sp. Soil756]|jgi:hypothetical protein|uniref:sulfotransferase family protein n=1 Tax=Nostocoides sp. Soil756 TaxID=1736399 RepID=UPI0006F8B575|nr:sulfotransferase [Tetrasphaera sp. Soil756]KRE62031.1 sulfotransferase [Tetrasphaera sp. Soil756]
MTLRSLVPASLEQAAGTAYVSIGRASAAPRIVPSFVMVGASRSGTTSLFRALSAHPAVVRPVVGKGVRYFDLNVTRPWSWYLGHFPLQATARLRSRGWGEPMAFEASGYYIFHPLAVPRLARAIPEVKVIAMLRDPVERAYSAWKHESARGFEWEPFQRALDLEDERLLGEVERMTADARYESFCHRHHSHRSRGEYADQVQRMWEHLGRDRVHVLQSESFFAQPEFEFARVLDFLGLPDFRPQAFEQHNARPGTPLDAGTRRRLASHYAPYNERLQRMIDEPLVWD